MLSCPIIYFKLHSLEVTKTEGKSPADDNTTLIIVVVVVVLVLLVVIIVAAIWIKKKSKLVQEIFYPTRFFYKQRCFSAQPQCCLTFS